jgi:hypothetical protein
LQSPCTVKLIRSMNTVSASTLNALMMRETRRNIMLRVPA